jgi:hypothetical protein
MIPPVFSFDYALFIEQFPEFSDDLIYPEARLQLFWNMATDYISKINCGAMNGDARRDALNMLVAHMAYMMFRIAAGKATGVVTGATIDKVSVQLLAPPVNSQFDFWLSQSPYGLMLLALLSDKSAGGGEVFGGSPVASSFRGPGGFFGSNSESGPC